MDTGSGLESKPGPVPGQKRKSQSSENEWVEYWSPRKNHKYWHNPSTGESVWKKPLSPAQPAISSSSSLPPGLLNRPFIPFKNYAEEYSSQIFEDFLKKYEEYNKSSNNIDGIHFAKELITSIVNTKRYPEAIKYVSDLLKSYISYKLKTSGSNLTIRDILEFNVHGTGHGGEYVAMPKDINPQYAPDKVYITAPPNIFAWGSQMPISKEYALRQHYNGNKLLLKRNDKKYFRERLHDEYARIEIKFDKEMKDIESFLIKLRNKKKEILSELNDPDAKINVLGRISPLMSCCSEWKVTYPKYVLQKSFYTKNDEKDVEKLFSMAETLLNEKKTAIQEKYKHSSLGVERSMTESFKCYDSTRLTDKRNIGQCIQTLSSGPDDWQHSYPNFDILFSLHTDDLELNSMIDAMFDIMQFDNNNLFENREGYKLNEKGFPFLMIEQLYKAFLNKSPDYRKISWGNSIYPAKLFDLLGPIGKVSIYGSFCCREGHKLEMDPYDSEGGRKKTRKRIRRNKRNRAKTRGRK